MQPVSFRRPFPGLLTREVCEELDRLMTAVERLSRLDAGFGLTIQDDSSGPRLALSSQLDNLDSVSVQNVTVNSSLTLQGGATVNLLSLTIASNYSWTINSGVSWTVNGPGVFVINAALEACGAFVWCEFTETAWLSAGVNDYAQSNGGPWKTIKRVSTSVSNTNLTGVVPAGSAPYAAIVGNPDELVMCIQNVGTSGTVTVTHEDAASAAANRFHLPGGGFLTIGFDQTALFLYDFTILRWRLVQTTGTVVNNPGSLTWVRLDYTYASFATAAMTNTLNAFSMPAGTVLHAVLLHHTVSFSGTGITTYNVYLDLDNGTNFAALDVAQATGGGVFFYATGSSTGMAPQDMNSAKWIRVRAVSTGANLNAASGTGAVTAWLLVSNPG